MSEDIRCISNTKKCQGNRFALLKAGNVRPTMKWKVVVIKEKFCAHGYCLSAVYEVHLGKNVMKKWNTSAMTDIWLLPAVFVVLSWLAVIPSVVLHSSSSFSSSSSWLSPASWPGSKDWLRPLSLSLQVCSEELLATGEAPPREEGLFVGLLATGCTSETTVRWTEVGGPPFLPKATCPLAAVLPGLLCTKLTPGPTLELFELTGGWGLQLGGGLEAVGLLLDCAFFPLDVRSGTGGGDEAGAAEEGWGEVGWRSWGTPTMKGGPSPCGEAGGVWKLSPWTPRGKKNVWILLVLPHWNIQNIWICRHFSIQNLINYTQDVSFFTDVGWRF